MKTEHLLLILFFIPTLLWSNPIDDTPIMKFSELVFDEHNNWVMELSFPFFRNNDRVDSILIETHGVSSMLKIRLRPNTSLYVITSDSLSVPLSITPDGAVITIRTYSNYFNKYKMDSTSFGKIQGAYAKNPLPGYSICKATIKEFGNYTDFVYIAKTPSLGAENSIIGIGEKLTGHMYDKDNKLVTKYLVVPVSGYYFEYQTPIMVNPDGTYLTIIYPEAFPPDSVEVSLLSVRLVDFGPLKAWTKTQAIEPIHLTYIHPDTVLIRDIHLKSNDYVLTGVEKTEIPKTSELALINYPNPFNSSTNFYVKLPDDIKDSQGEIKIYNSNGQLIRIIQAKNGATSFWDGKDMKGNAMASGIYYYQLNVNSSKLKSGSMILLK